MSDIGVFGGVGYAGPDQGLLNVISNASNLAIGTNPTYTQDNFYEWYPNFNGLVPNGVLNSFIAMAQATVLQSRWFTDWPFGMANFIAHFCTMWLRTQQGNGCASAVIGAAESRGLISSESVGDVSNSYDTTKLNDIDGWAVWVETDYGKQYMSMAKNMVKGPMLIY